jgi:thiol-disulfide isomerase/thioredoxin
LRNLPKIIILLICLFLPAIVFAQKNQEDKAPAITLKDINGKSVRISDFKGKIILLNFWATWCPPCRAEIPELTKWQKEYENQGLQIIGVTYPPTNRKKVRSFVRQNAINYPILFGSKNTKELFTSADTMPFSVVIDRDGQITERIEGIIYAEEFDEKIKPLLELKSNKIDSTL